LLWEPEAGWLRIPAASAGGSLGNAGRVKLLVHRGDADLALDLGAQSGRARLTGTHLDLEPYWRKADVRNLREGTGDVAMVEL
jgi:hypothetical protein